MKPRIAPTSPKSRVTEEAVTDLYRNHTLLQPSAPHLGWVIVVALVLGAVAGAVSPWVVGQLAGRFPGVGWLNRLRLNPPSSTVIREVTVRETTDRGAAILDHVRPSLVAIYNSHGEADIASAAYSPDQALGWGIVATSDGVILTTADVISDLKKPYVIARSDGTVATVNRIIRDPLTPFILLITSGSHLNAAKFATSLPTAPGTVLRAVRLSAPTRWAAVWPASMVSPTALPVTKPSDWLESTESYNRLVTLAPAPPSAWNGAAVIDENENVIGLWSAARGGALPLPAIATRVTDAPSGDIIQRFTVGLHFIDISQGLGLPSTLRQDLPENGALIFGSDDGHIIAVQPKSPASRAGVKANDIIVSVDGTAVDLDHPLTLLLQSAKDGKDVVLTIRRGQRTETIVLQPGTP